MAFLRVSLKSFLCYGSQLDHIGIGIKLFDEDEKPNTVASIMVLTDGMPNHMSVDT